MHRDGLPSQLVEDPWLAVELFMAQSDDLALATDAAIDDAIQLLLCCGEIEGAYDIRAHHFMARKGIDL